MRPGTFIVEPDLAERWEEPDDTTYIFHLRKGVKWHNKPPVNGRELVAEDVKFTYDRFLTEKGNPERQLLDSVDRVEVVDRYTVKFVLKEPFVWLLDILANAMCMWIIAPEVAEKYGDFKKVETAIGTGPFLLERYEPNVKTIFKRNPDYFRDGLPYLDGVEWLVVQDESTGLAMYRTGQLDTGPGANWQVRQPDLESLKQSHPSLHYQDIQMNNATTIWMRTDKSPFNDVSVRRAISLALDRQGIIEAVWMRGSLSPRFLLAWLSGRCPLINSVTGRSTTGTIPRKPSAYWRKSVMLKASRRRSRPPAATAATSSMRCRWSCAILRRLASTRS